MDIRNITARLMIVVLTACALTNAAAAQVAAPDQKLDLECERYLSPAASLSGKSYPEKYSIKLEGGMWRITSPALSTQGTWAEAPQPAGMQILIMSRIVFKWKNGSKAADLTYVGTMQNAFGRYVVAEIGHYDAPPLSFFCAIKS